MGSGGTDKPVPKIEQMASWGDNLRLGLHRAQEASEELNGRPLKIIGHKYKLHGNQVKLVEASERAEQVTVENKFGDTMEVDFKDLRWR